MKFPWEILSACLLAALLNGVTIEAPRPLVKLNSPKNKSCEKDFNESRKFYLFAYAYSIEEKHYAKELLQKAKKMAQDLGAECNPEKSLLLERIHLRMEKLL